MKQIYFGVDNHAHPDSVHVPLIRIEYRKADEGEVKAFLDDMPEFTHIVFTSKHGVEAFFLLQTLEDLHGKVVISIGEVTTDTLRKKGVCSILTAEEATQEGVLQVLNLLDLSHAYIGIPCSSKARSTLSAQLAYRGVRHCIGHVYDTVLSEDVDFPDLSECREVIVTSPSTVDALKTHVVDIPDHVLVTVQGEVTKRRFQSVFSKKILN